MVSTHNLYIAYVHMLSSGSKHNIQETLCYIEKPKTLYNHSCILNVIFGSFKDYKESILIKK